METNNNWKSMIALIASVLLLLVTVVALSIIKPDLSPNPEVVHKMLQKRGYNVCGVEFEFVRTGERYYESIFQSSAPIYFEGNYVSQWKVITNPQSSLSFLPRYTVKAL